MATFPKIVWVIWSDIGYFEAMESVYKTEKAAMKALKECEELDDMITLMAKDEIVEVEDLIEHEMIGIEETPLVG